MFSDGMSGPPGPRNHKSRPPGRKNAWSVRSVRASTRTARMVNEVERLMKLWARQELLEAGRFNRAVGDLEVPERLDKEHRLARLCFDERESRGSVRQPKRNCRRATARPDVDDRRRRGHMARCHHGLDEQPVDRFVVRIGQRERGEVDFGVPASQQLEILLEAVEQRAVRGDAGLAQAPGQAFVKVLPGHDLRVVESAALGEALDGALVTYACKLLIINDLMARASVCRT